MITYTTLVKNRHFVTFRQITRNDYREYTVLEGTIHGLTYTVEDVYTFGNDVQASVEGNDYFRRLLQEGYIEWEKYCRQNNLTCLLYDFGTYLD